MGMELIEHIEVGSGGAGSITFASIAADYTDLKIVISARNSNASNDNDFVFATFNADSGSNYSWRRLYGTGSTVASSSSSTTYLVAGRSCNNGRTSNTFSNTSFYIPNYASSNQKSTSTDSVEENNATTAFQDIYAGLWTGTAAITSITLGAGSYSFLEYSTASLYGIS
tara:strand:- start:23 stop:529 length:507 start_codon:yes stop_codon:yes gene_type:complete